MPRSAKFGAKKCAPKSRPGVSLKNLYGKSQPKERAQL
jgi:hypothetical protein